MAKVTKTIKPSFDPTKNYNWKPDDEFVLSGEEFSLVYNTIASLANQGSFSVPPIQIVLLHNRLHSLLERGIEAGVVIEVPPQQS